MSICSIQRSSTAYTTLYQPRSDYKIASTTISSTLDPHPSTARRKFQRFAWNPSSLTHGVDRVAELDLTWAAMQHSSSQHRHKLYPIRFGCLHLISHQQPSKARFKSVEHEQIQNHTENQRENSSKTSPNILDITEELQA